MKVPSGLAVVVVYSVRSPVTSTCSPLAAARRAAVAWSITASEEAEVVTARSAGAATAGTVNADREATRAAEVIPAVSRIGLTARLCRVLPARLYQRTRASPMDFSCNLHNVRVSK